MRPWLPFTVKVQSERRFYSTAITTGNSAIATTLNEEAKSDGLLREVRLRAKSNGWYPADTQQKLPQEF